MYTALKDVQIGQLVNLKSKAMVDEKMEVSEPPSESSVDVQAGFRADGVSMRLLFIFLKGNSI